MPAGLADRLQEFCACEDALDLRRRSGRDDAAVPAGLDITGL